jgi:ABC-type transport system substrate-binding protein
MKNQKSSSSVSTKLGALSLLVVLTASSILLFVPALAPVSNAVAATSSTSGPTVGILFPPVSTFFQSANEEYIGNTATDIPYLAVGRLSITGNVVPGICQVPTAVSGSNNTQWIENLISPNLKWSDGVPINSTDLAYSFGIYMTSGPYANTSNIDRWGADRTTFSNITILNSTAIQITTKTPDPRFPLLTFLYTIYPYHYYQQFGFGNNQLQTTPVLSGPGDSAYVPANYTAGSYTMSLKANPNSPSWNGTTPTFNTMTLQFFTSDSSQVNSLASNSIDAGLITPSDISSLTSNSQIGITQIPSDYQLMIYVKSTGYPWNETAFRQALMYLVNRTQVNDALYGGNTSTGNPAMLIPQAMSTYYPSSGVPLYNYSVSTAKTLLAQAGLTQNSQGKWMLPNGTALTVTVEAPNNDPNYVRASQFIQTSFQNAGITVNLDNPAYSTADTDWTSLNFQFLIFPNNYAPSPFRWMRNPFNIPGWTNSTFKSEFALALSDPNQSSAFNEVKQAEVIMAQAAVINSIVILPQYVAYNKALFSNWQPALSNAPSSSVFWDPVSAENVLTAIAPAGASSSTTTGTYTGTSSVTAPSSTTSGTGVVTTTTTSKTGSSITSNNNLYVYAGIAVVTILLLATAAAFMGKRRPEVRK